MNAPNLDEGLQNECRELAVEPDELAPQILNQRQFQECDPRFGRDGHPAHGKLDVPLWYIIIKPAI